MLMNKFRYGNVSGVHRLQYVPSPCSQDVPDDFDELCCDTQPLALMRVVSDAFESVVPFVRRIYHDRVASTQHRVREHVHLALV